MKPDYWDDAKEALGAVDPILKQLIKTYPDEHLSSKRQLFRTLANAIVGQQISVAAAESIWKRFRTALGGRVTPPRILALDSQTMRACGLSGRKVEYLIGIAEKFSNEYKHLRWSRMTDAEIHQRLIALRGIGPWTVDMVMIFSFLRPDVLPLLDIGMVRSMEKHFNQGEALTHQEMLTIAEPWKPYRTVATWYLWRDIDPDPVAY